MAEFSKGRGIMAAGAAAAVLWLVARTVLVPAYRDITGFVPFDLQSPLSHVMIGVELGAFEERAALGAYAAFAAVDFALGIAKAALFIFVWMWLFDSAPTRIFSFLRRGGILLLPLYVVILDGAAKVGFHRLLQGLSGEALSATIEYCATVHRLHMAVADIRNLLTAVFLALAAAVTVRRLRGG